MSSLNHESQSVLQPDFWEAAWQNYRVVSQRKSRQTSQQEEEFQTRWWNKRAESFSRRNVGSAGQRRVELAFSVIEQTIELKPGMRVLDVGCGPGTFALPFVERGLNVTGLDPSGKMLDLLRGNIPQQYSDQLETAQGLWEDVNIDDVGWRGQFDLVFASMVPGVHDRETIEKLIKCSRGGVYLSAFASPRASTLYHQIWPDLFNRPYQLNHSNIIFPFNLLFSLGYRPNLRFEHHISQRKDTVEAAVDDVRDQILSLELDAIPTELADKIQALVQEKAQDGLVHHQFDYWVGMMCWRQEISF